MDQNAPKFHQIYTIFICCDLELVSLKFVICNDSTGVIVGLFAVEFAIMKQTLNFRLLQCNDTHSDVLNFNWKYAFIQLL